MAVNLDDCHRGEHLAFSAALRANRRFEISQRLPCRECRCQLRSLFRVTHSPSPDDVCPIISSRA